jgi:hypothetical protein
MELGEVFDAHTNAEFKTRDIDATMATMSVGGIRGDVQRLPSGSWHGEDRD